MTRLAMLKKPSPSINPEATITSGVSGRPTRLQYHATKPPITRALDEGVSHDMTTRISLSGA